MTPLCAGRGDLSCVAMHILHLLELYLTVHSVFILFILSSSIVLCTWILYMVCHTVNMVFFYLPHCQFCSSYLSFVSHSHIHTPSVSHTNTMTMLFVASARTQETLYTVCLLFIPDDGYIIGFTISRGANFYIKTVRVKVRH